MTTAARRAPTARRHLALALPVALALACAEPDRPLDVHRALGSAPEDLFARWGPPKQYTPDPHVEGKFGFAMWPDVHGARIFIAVRQDRVTWITYRFPKMEPFDLAAALEQTNIQLPEQGGRQIPAAEGARRWEPFEGYRRLTINPQNRLITVGADPVRHHFVDPEQAADAGLLPEATATE